jgi:hypothetical protein
MQTFHVHVIKIQIDVNNDEPTFSKWSLNKSLTIYLNKKINP